MVNVLIVGHGIPKFIPIPEDRLKELEAKAKELDRREKGVAVKGISITHEGVVANCGNCNKFLRKCDKHKYCHNCGTKLIWEVSE